MMPLLIFNSDPLSGFVYQMIVNHATKVRKKSGKENNNPVSSMTYWFFYIKCDTQKISPGIDSVRGFPAIIFFQRRRHVHT